MSRRLQVLVVTPNVRTGRGTRAWLRAAGYDVCMRTTFSAGVRCLQRDPDLVIADVRLGAFNGLHLAMRAIWTGIPAIVMGFEDGVLRREAAAMGAAYLAGHVDARALLAMVESLASMTLPRVGRSDWAPVPASGVGTPVEPMERGVVH
jgi:DNA-binding response OmpR family regulator